MLSLAARGLGIDSSHSSASDEVLVKHDGRMGLVTLNRPKALNSLNLGMIKTIKKTYKAWDVDPNVRVVVLRSGDSKAFCAGGDVRALYKAGKENEPLKTEFFVNEYELNHLIHTLQKPHVSIVDGITMGGGAGLSVHGHFVIATENTKFAMPEVGIGFAPDVGGSFFLSRLPRGYGQYLALTGKPIVGSDVKAAGIATHFIRSEQIPAVIEILKSSIHSSYYDYDQALKVLEDATPHNVDGWSSIITPNATTIDKCFSNKTSVANIIKALKSESDPFAKETLQAIESVSPLAVHIAHELIKRGHSLSLADCLQMEYTVVQRCLMGTEFYEGVRAALIDKDRKPKWNPAKLADVSLDAVLAHFEDIPGLPKIPLDTSRKHVRT
jgi:3-hydroxyisobutyryl-CoA hydrolase